MRRIEEMKKDIYLDDIRSVLDDVEDMDWNDMKKAILRTGDYTRDVFDKDPINMWPGHITTRIIDNKLVFYYPMDWEEDGDEYESDIIFSYDFDRKELTGNFGQNY